MTRADVLPDDPLRLARAAELAFPDGSMSAKGLRRERDAGRLAVMMIAGKEYTTLAAIERMKELCLAIPKVQGSAPKPRGRARTAGPARPSGSSGTEERSAALASALRAADTLQTKPSTPSKRTAKRNGPQLRENVVALRPTYSVRTR